MNNITNGQKFGECLFDNLVYCMRTGFSCCYIYRRQTIGRTKRIGSYFKNGFSKWDARVYYFTGGKKLFRIFPTDAYFFHKFGKEFVRVSYNNRLLMRNGWNTQEPSGNYDRNCEVTAERKNNIRPYLQHPSKRLDKSERHFKQTQEIKCFIHFTG